MKHKLVIIFANFILIAIVGLIFMFVICLTWVVSWSLYFNNGDTSTDGLAVIAVVFSGMWGGVLLSPFSLIPSYFLSMKLARYLRDKKGWTIDRPRKLFAISILLPIAAIILLITIGYIFNIG